MLTSNFEKSIHRLSLAPPLFILGTQRDHAYQTAVFLYIPRPYSSAFEVVYYKNHQSIQRMQFENLAALKAHIGKPIASTEWITVTQTMINDFAEATMDKQWIHIDVERAKKESPFGKTIAHGFMSVAMASKFVEEALSIKSVKMGLNYGLNKVRFPHPVPVDARLRMHPTVAEVEDYGDNGAKVMFDIVIEIEGVEKPACAGQFIILLFE